MANVVDVIVTGETSKLPAEYAALVDPSKPLPANVVFFEKKIIAADFMTTTLIAIGLAILGLIMVPIGISFVRHSFGDRFGPSRYDWWPLVFGVVCLFASWLMIASLRTSWRLMKVQSAGKPTRIGIFLNAASLFEVNEFGYCIIPRAQFRGVEAGKVKYVMGGQDKSFKLPASLMGGDINQLTAEIDRWARSTPVV